MDEQKCAQEYRDAIELPAPFAHGANNFKTADLQHAASVGEHNGDQNPDLLLQQQLQMKEIIMRRSCW